MTQSDPLSADADQIFRDDLLAIIPSLRSFARGLCGGREMADDLAQDAMMRAWAARTSFTPGTNFRAWMFMILRNQFYTTIRKNSRMKLFSNWLVIPSNQASGAATEWPETIARKAPQCT